MSGETSVISKVRPPKITRGQFKNGETGLSLKFREHFEQGKELFEEKNVTAVMPIDSWAHFKRFIVLFSHVNLLFLLFAQI